MDPERRVVNILFADIVGSTALGETLDAVEALFLVGTAQAALADTVKQYGGHVVKLLGDGLTALFGAPVAREDDAERAVLAALEMHRALQRTNETRPPSSPALQLRVGVTSGDVVVGTMVGAYDVSGDAANTAARLQSAAEVGGVLVGEETRQRAERRIRKRRHQGTHRRSGGLA
jgi:class 3 adenylate cyclase